MAGLLVISLTLSASGLNVSAGNPESVSVNEIITGNIEEVGTEDGTDAEIVEDVLVAGAQRRDYFILGI